MPSEFRKHFAGEDEAVLTAILTQSRDCIKLLNLAGEIEYINPNGLATLGLSQPEPLLGRDWRDLWPADGAARINQALEAALRGETTRLDAFGPTGAITSRWWDISIGPVRAADGAIVRVLAISRDVTTQVEAHLAERERRVEAEREADHAGDIAREMRHRLKNLLAVVSAVAKLLARHTVDARDLAGKLEDKLIALSRAQDLLTIRRDQPVTAPEAVAQVIDASGAGERIVADDIPALCLPDESIQQLALILGELQTNALKHGALRGEEGRVEVTGTAGDGMLTLRWQEDCARAVAPVEAGHGGFQLIRRLGSARGLQPVIAWLPRGIVVEFHVRTAPRGGHGTHGDAAHSLEGISESSPA